MIFRKDEWKLRRTGIFCDKICLGMVRVNSQSSVVDEPHPHSPAERRYTTSEFLLEDLSLAR